MNFACIVSLKVPWKYKIFLCVWLFRGKHHCCGKHSKLDKKNFRSTHQQRLHPVRVTVIPSRELESVGAYNMTCCFATSQLGQHSYDTFWQQDLLHRDLSTSQNCSPAEDRLLTAGPLQLCGPQPEQYCRSHRSYISCLRYGIGLWIAHYSHCRESEKWRIRT